MELEKERNGYINDVIDRKIIELRNRFNNVKTKKKKQKCLEMFWDMRKCLHVPETKAEKLKKRIFVLGNRKMWGSYFQFRTY